MRKRISRIRPVKQPASCQRERIHRVSKGIRIVREPTYFLTDEQIFISEDKSVSSVKDEWERENSRLHKGKTRIVKA